MPGSQYSKRENKYRTRFIQECYYNKEEQKVFDKEVAAMSVTYKKVYKTMRSGFVYTFMALIASNRISRAFYIFGTSAAEATESVRAMLEAFSGKE